MTKRICVIDLPGLSGRLLKAIPANSSLGKWLATQPVAALQPSWPAVTCSVQATLTTGVEPDVHGIIANGIATYRSKEDQAFIDASNFASYRREVSFWEQSNQLLDAKRFWQDNSGKSRFKTALLFFQQSMPGFVDPKKPAADIVITPKPEHGPDGNITSLCWSSPSELIGELSKSLGPFPLMNYWGPMSNIKSSEWIARAAAMVWDQHEPTLQLTYVPHLDYDLQRFGPDSPQAIRAVEDVAAALAPVVNAALASNSEIVLLSEYAMQPVKRAIAPNRILAEAGLLVTRDTPDGKLIDYEKSSAFAMVDHQIGHIYIQPHCNVAAVADALIRGGVFIVDMPHSDLQRRHRRQGQMLVEAAPADTWLDYRWWTDASDAPTFATRVDIHRKPGYDPLELFLDMATRTITQNASLIRGSHGAVRTSTADETSPIIAGALPDVDENTMRAVDFGDYILKRIAGS